MEQLNGYDTFFLASQHSRAPGHIAHMRVYDPSTAKKSVVRFKEIIECFEQRLHMSPLFRKQLASVPFDLDASYWIESPDFNIENHIHHLALPKPGDWRQLCILVTRLHGRPLNMRHPLWEAYVIEGLDNVKGMPKGAFAVLIKAHHAIADGMTFDKMLEAIHDKEATPKKIKESFWKPEPIPTNTELMLNTLGNYVKQPAKSVNRLRKVIGSSQRGNQFLKDHPEAGEKQQEQCIFNGAVNKQRVFGSLLIDLSDLKAIKNQIPGATINDVVLTISSYSVSRYLAHHGKSIDEEFRVNCPLNGREISEYSDGYNYAAVLNVSVHNKIADPFERLMAIHESTNLAKAHLAATGPDQMRNVFDSLPNFALSMGFKLAGRYGWMADQAIGAHYLLTNVPGPREARYLAGAKAVCSFGLAPVFDGLGLVHMVSSYVDKLSISFQSCEDMIPDPEFYQDCLRDAFELLLNRANAESPAKPAKAKKITKSARG